ncbi:MAG: response regulator transcription factor [Chloroflexota bacterium]
MRGATATGATIMLVEDDRHVAALLMDILQSGGYTVRHAGTGAAAMSLLDEARPDLIILDLMLPDADGLVLCADLRARAAVPIVVCSATPVKRDSILALKLGADDFIAKPFAVDELLARVAAVLRRTAPAVPAPLAPSAVDQPAPQEPTPEADPPSPPRVDRISQLVLDHTRRQVTLGGHEVPLTPTEYRLLTALASRPDEVLSRQELAHQVWGYEDASIGRSIDVHIHRLRAKIEAAVGRTGIEAPVIVSVRGFGYRITAEHSIPSVPVTRPQPAE